MRRYEIYLIEDEVASVYFGREEMLFKLFRDRKEESIVPVNILERQIEYITRSIPSFKIDQMIKGELDKNRNYQYRHFLHKIELSNGNAELIIYEKYLALTSNGDLETEMIFFEILRKFESCYLAIDYENKRYGWLNPLKEERIGNRKRIVVL